MEIISQSHENSTATLWPPHGLSPLKTLEAESVHEVVGGRGATLAAAASAEGGGWLGGGGAANAWLAAAELRPPTRSAELAAQRGVWASGSLLEYQRAHQDRPAPHGPGWQMFTEEGYHLGGFLRGCSRSERTRRSTNESSTSPSSARARRSRMPSSLSSRMRRAFAWLHHASSLLG